MKVLVIGSGGREHALVWKIAQGKSVEKVYCIPGNAGISRIADRPFGLPLDDFKAIADFVRKEKIGLTVVGPEAPLVKGMADFFRKEGLAIFGPGKEPSRLEGSKVFAKIMMEEYGVPTAPFEIFKESKPASDYIKKKGAPIVVKADGLAAGKGAIVCKTEDEAIDSVRRILDEKIFGDAGARVVIEECLPGEEISMLALVDRDTCVPLISSQDHKRIFDDDKGPNTGGMGAYSPVPLLTEELDLDRKIREEVFGRMMRGFKKEGISFNGILYAGIMVSGGVPYVLEFNVRFGDPETQAILPLLDTDLAQVLLACANNQLNKIKLKWKKGTCVCVVAASGGYPNAYEKEKEIKGLDAAAKRKDVVIFHAGTALKDGKVVTAGGRVLGVTAIGRDITDARSKAYETVKDISFDGMQFRRDIGVKALKY
ncbi:phosphoribosylamine--glycine ligase [Candidatus Desantisbacteria bacterium CG_4_10_14_0_8_um_filter_48_22]|uniref:Phosphoribosylamine--glycine ligase n=1 Tax=Candidatus Desantisbacteria bacterium CG_4_10_14_0_8_um_filter_48_22 TaxID=1974543 RepID=A0A2M7SEX6_9BACT|nr:MAG: phosphoribosylamine--glycine ligase [Candidatus Desantisbacteria bacterium CG1_02_49_89]PIZ18058.1 MAG: phosphoribosylamine--glycine ligase [Candidatus Desantisbacteria bacterium CG_4_10_14_0_8_um_filter_48_22]